MADNKTLTVHKSFTAGNKSKAIFDEEQKYIAPGAQQIGTFSQIVMERGEGCYFVDVDGNKYFDLYAGVGIASLGHSHPAYVKAMQEQVSKITVGSFTTKNRTEFMKLLSSVTPGDLNRTQMYSGGAETVEAAQKLAKSYTGNYEFVGFWGGFHGKTMGVLGLLGDTFKHNYGPLPAGVHLVPYAYCYRCPFKTTYPKCGLLCAEYVRDNLKFQTTGKIAAFVMEPIQGTNGNVVPPKGYVKAIADIAHENDALFVADEIITCLGRTGKMFACQHEDVVPDIMTMGKGIACGFPVSLLVSSDKIANSKPFANPSGSSSSFGGNPMAATACKVVLETIIKENLVENSRVVGKYMLDELKKLQEKYRFIGDVRGRGLMIGVEMVKDKKTKKPLPKEITKTLYYECLKRGVMGMCYSKTIRINPPLIITKKQAQEVIGKLTDAFDAISDRFNLG
ncbi:MAG TPA: aspartate aminotransferase family protein [Elusimicrobiales bacterium]|nr:aspartate aminotransferase family protein [Elusimicrobiales bacterium]